MRVASLVVLVVAASSVTAAPVSIKKEHRPYALAQASHAIDALQSDVALEERGAGGDGIFGFLKFLKKKPNATSAEGVPSDSTILARGEALENPAKKPWSRKRKALVTTGALAGSVGIGLGIGYGVDAAIELSRKGD